MKMAERLLSLYRDFWEEPASFCLGVHHSLPGPSHVLHLALQHHHEGEVPNKCVGLRVGLSVDAGVHGKQIIVSRCTTLVSYPPFNLSSLGHTGRPVTSRHNSPAVMAKPVDDFLFNTVHMFCFWST